MKKIILIALILLSFNALSEEFDFSEFEAELESLEALSELEDSNEYIDQITTLQAASEKVDENYYADDYKIIPLPGFESSDTNETNPPSETKTPRVRKN